MTQQPNNYQPVPLNSQNSYQQDSFAGAEHYTPQYFDKTQSRNPFSAGYGLNQPQMVIVKQKSVLLAYVLWFFLGYLGIHKFYLRQPIIGILYIILFGLGTLTAHIVIGWFPLILWGLLMLLDIFTIPLRVTIMNAIATSRAMSY